MSRLASSKTAQIWAERIAQCERSNAPVAQFCQSIGCSPMFSPSGVVKGDLWVRRTGSPSYRAIFAATDWKSVVQRVRRTSSPSAKAYRWINRRDGLEVRRTRRSKRKRASAPQATAFLRLQTSDSNKDSIEIKLPEAGLRPEAIGGREQPNSRKTLVRSSEGIQ